MKSRLLKTLAIVAIILLFFGTRLYKIAQIPPSLYWDEASIGYNAYSVVETGKDEWDKRFPVHFRAFGEFKLPVYIYSVALSQKFLGFNDFSVRFPAVVFSLVAVIATYFIARKITGKVWVGIASAFILSVSPWLFIFSRTGYEATAGLAFFLIGLYLFLLSFDQQKKYLFFPATLSFVLSLYSYNSYRVIVPIIFPFLVIYYLRIYWKEKGRVVVFLSLSIVLLVLSYIQIWRLVKFDAGFGRLSAIRITKLSDFGKNYFSHFSSSFLFMKGDSNVRSQLPGFGQLYLIELPLIIFGIVGIFKKKKIYYFLPILMVLISPIPAAITRESPHALRSLSMLPFLSIISAIGIEFLTDKLKKYKVVIATIFIVGFLASFENYLASFVNDYSKLSSEDWQYGYKRVFTDYKNEFDKFDRVIISEEYAQPYIFALYYLKIDPNKFRSSVTYNSVDRWGFSTAAKIGKFEFKKIEAKDFKPGTIIFSDKIENGARKPNSEIRNLDGSLAFEVYKL